MSKRVVQYSFLTISILGLLVAAYIVPARALKSVLIIAISALYFAFGIFHHLEERNLNSKIIWEYLALSLLVFVVLFSLLVGGV
ncbi:MAG: hypothetical protein Q8P13_03685 [bacterium]|nr:hypothetical protein [bacterium]